MYRPQPKTSFVYLARPPQLFFFDEFITPLDHSVFELTKVIDGDSLEAVGARCFDIVRPVEYVTDLSQFGVEDFFMFPFEVLKSRKGDCEDQANLLTSLLTGCGVTGAATVYGIVRVNEKEYAHAWTEVGGVFIESTLDEYKPMERPAYYLPEMAVAWGYSYPVGYGVGWMVNNSPPERKLPKLTPEELKKLHDQLKGAQ